MPNHVTTKMTAPKEVLDFMKSREEDFDFSNIIPIPETASSYPQKGGFPSEHYWRIDNWGTKWNAYKIKRKDDTNIKFKTAWSFPTPVIIALSIKFPESEIYCDYADEDIGYNCGSLLIFNGEIIDIPIDGDKKRFACKVCGYDYDEYIAEHEE